MRTKTSLRFLFSTLVCLVGQISVTAQPCACFSIFDSLCTHLEVNYIGYQDVQKRIDLPSIKAAFAKSIGPIMDPVVCTEQLNSFLTNFKDGHLGVRYAGNLFEQENHPETVPAWPDISEEIARSYLDLRKGTDSLEGIWESYEGLYKVFIRKEMQAKIYEAFLLETVNQNWKKGEIKMRFEPDEKGKMQLRYFMSGHKTKNPDYELNRNILEIKNRIVFRKLYPHTIDPIPFESFVSGHFGLSEEFIQWNPETFYIQLQNITAGNKPLIDSLVGKHDVAIRKSQNLIIDLRDNEGGDFTCFEKLWPYILSNPVVLYGTTYRCTPANIVAYKAQLKNIEEQILPDFQEFANELNQHIGQDWLIPNDTIQPISSGQYPEKVILLVNGRCQSSTENFILTAMQSKKVLVAGETTGGVADYEEVVDFPLSCKYMVLQMPIGKSNRLPVNPLDGMGIVPILKLKHHNKAWQPWVKEVVKALKK